MNPAEPHRPPFASGRHGPADGNTAARAFELACHRVERARLAGKLLSPTEALALAGAEARSKETLFSIARSIAWDLDCDQDDLLRQLAHRYPHFDLAHPHPHALMSDED